MECVLDWVPTSSLWYDKTKIQSTQCAPATLKRNGVLIYDILGKRNHCDKSYLPRFYFLLPGRLVYSRNLRSADDALAEAIADGDKNNRTLDVTPNFKIEYLNSRCFRVWNSLGWVPDPTSVFQTPSTSAPSNGSGSSTKKRSDLIMSGDPTPETITAQFTTDTASSDKSPSTLQMLSTPAMDSADSDKVLTPLSSVEAEQSVTILFNTDEQAQEWEAALLAERDRVYMPEILQIPSFARQVNYAVWKTVNAGVGRTFFETMLPLRRLYFDHETSPLLLHLFNLFSSGSKTSSDSSLMLEHVDSFVDLLRVIAGSLPTLNILLGLRLPSDLLEKFAADKKAIAAQFPTLFPASQPVYSESTEAVEFVDFARYVAFKTGAEVWAKNRAVLPWLLGYPEKLKFLGARKWFMKISSARGKFAHPFKISWAQLKLLLEPTPFLGFFFVDHYVNVGDVKRARTVCAGLPYDMTASFPAVYRSPETEVSAAHFIHYLEWDSLQRAYEEFEGINPGNQRLVDIITVIRGVYSAPLASAAHWAALAFVSEAEVMDDCIAQLLDGMETETVPELVIVREICARWMQFTRKTHGFCKAPKKGLILTVMTVAAWAQNFGNLPDNSHSKAILALTAMNEDRALLNALLAIYLAKGLGKHVHILYSTSQSLFRDCTRLAPFLQTCDVTTAMNDFSQAADVTYCLQRDVTQFYRDSIFFGHTPFANTVLLVDDMDELEIDRNPNSIYGKKDDELTQPLKGYFDVLLEHGLDIPFLPPGAESGTGAITWAKTKAAYLQYRDMRENAPNGYIKVVGANSTPRYELLDADGRIATHKYSGGLEMVRYKLAGELPSINSKFFYQSLPHMFGQYEGIVGIGSKSSGPGAEVPENRGFLERVYGLWSFNVPEDQSQKNFPTRENAGTMSLVDETVINIKASDDKVAEGVEKSGVAASVDLPVADISTGGGNGLDARWPINIPRTPDAKYEPSTAGMSDLPSTHYTSIPNLPDIVKGQMMNELCDKFYLRYPHDDSKWPSKQGRLLVEFLENEALQGPSSIGDFAASVGLCRSAASYESAYDEK